MAQFPLFTGANDVGELRAYLNRLVNAMNNPTEFSTNLEVAGTLTVDGASTLTGAVTMSSTAHIVGAATIDASLLPDADDGAVLGAATTGFSDLFLASGAVINFANGNLTLTHSSGILTNSAALVNTGAITLTGGIAIPAGTGLSLSKAGFHTGNAPAMAAADGFDTTPAVTETFIAPVLVPYNCTITGIAIFNGSATGSGNVTAGLASSTGAPIAAAVSASTAIAGTDDYQLVPFAVAYAAKGPAIYYVQTQYNNTSSRFNTHLIGAFGTLKQTGQTYGTLTSFTPPLTFAANVGPIATLY